MRETSFKIYDASAGSGKTYMLVKEYLKLLLSGNSKQNYRRILAITFTNKAVNEMKQRILGSLHEFGEVANIENAPSMFMEIASEINVDTATLRNRSKEVLKEILHNYAFFDVSTIDKFTHRLIRTFAKDLKLPRNFEVILDTDLLLEEAVAKLLAKAGIDAQLTKILMDFALEKIDDDKSWDLAFDLNKIGALLFEENHVPHLKKLEGKGIEDFLELKKTILAKMTELKKEMTASASEALNLIKENGLQFADFYKNQFPNFMLQLKENSQKINFDADWKNNFKSTPLYVQKCPEDIKAVIDALSGQFATLFAKAKHNFHRLSLLKNVYKNIVPLTLLSAIQKEVKTLETERDQLPISDFNTIISNQIKDQPAPFIYERLGEKYRHYFIDEFQDTSTMQWNNLIPLIGNALESVDEQGKKGSLLLVGDAKQAIYRWRGGRAEQFLNLINLATNPFVVPPQVEHLPTNYRSHGEIIKFNNDFFTKTSPFLNNSLYNQLFVKGNRQEYNIKKGGLVQINFLREEDTDKDELYCQQVLQIINEVLGKDYGYRDICILTRKRKHGMLLADFLMRQNIPVISSETLLLNASPKVQFLINLLRFNQNPQDLETAYQILSFLVGDNGDKHNFIYDNTKNLGRLLKSDYGFRSDIFDQLSVYDGLEKAIKYFDLAKPSDAYVTYFMDVVLEVEQREGTDPQTFLSHWEKKKDKLGTTAPENVNAVRMMTVHKAKGLEFPIVIFPYANTNIYEEIEPKLWLPVEKKHFNGFEEVLVNKKQEVVNYGPEAEALYNEEQHKLELDAFNLLYVALTRAIKGLFIITEKDLVSRGKQPKYYSELFIHYLKEKGEWDENISSYTFGSLEAAALKSKTENSEEYLSYQYTYKDRPSFRILTTSGILWDTKREDALSTGNLIHYIMGLIETDEDIQGALTVALQNGDIPVDEMGTIRKTVLQIVRHPQLERFYKEGYEIKNEKDIITGTGAILRPDRLAIKNKSVTILDYKTGSRNSRYHEQLYAYADALETMGYLVENKIIVYIDEHITPEFI